MNINKKGIKRLVKRVRFLTEDIQQHHDILDRVLEVNSMHELELMKADIRLFILEKHEQEDYD